jgi:flavin reductase (DIM6/NTAB) family NADH-FMN oxidoreductase RutF
MEPQLVGESVQHGGGHDMDMAVQAKSPDPSVCDSATFTRLVRSESHNDPSKKPTRKKKTCSRQERLLQGLDRLENDGYIDDPSRSSNDPSFSGGGASNIEPATRHRAKGSSETYIRSGLEHESAATEACDNSSGPCTSYPNSLTSKTTTTGRNPSNEEKTAKNLSTRRTRSSNRIRDPNSPERVSATSAIKERMRQCMRRVPQAAVIVTATNSKDPQNPFRGATVSSFTTVTFEPRVVVSLNLKLPSATFDAIQVSKCFNVNNLRASDKGAEIASQFARGHDISPFNDAEWQSSEWTARRLRRIQPNLPPVLYRGRDWGPVASFFSCTYLSEKTVEVGDHVVIFGAVERVHEKSNKRHMEGHNTWLAYIDGCYGRVKPLVNQPREKSNEVSVHNNLNAPIAASTQHSISRQDFTALASHAMDGIEYYQKTFYSEVHLRHLRSRTAFLVRKLRYQCPYVYSAILAVSKAANDVYVRSRSHTSLVIEIHRLLAFYFIFCGSHHIHDELFSHLPHSIAGRREEYVGHVVHVERSLGAMRYQLDASILTDPHPLYALQKAPRSINLARPFLRKYAEWFLTTGNLDSTTFYYLPEQTFKKHVIPYYMRMQLMRVWLRKVWVSEEHFTLLDPLLDVPTHSLVWIRNLLVLCAQPMLIPRDLLSTLFTLPARAFKESLFRYDQLCSSLWKDLAAMRFFDRQRTTGEIMRQWKLRENGLTRLGKGAFKPFTERHLGNMMSCMAVEKRMLHEALAQEADETLIEQAEEDEDVLGLLHDTAIRDSGDDRIVSEVTTDDSIINLPYSSAQSPSQSSAEVKSYLRSGVSSHCTREPPAHPKLTPHDANIEDQLRRSDIAQKFVGDSAQTRCQDQRSPWEQSSVRTLALPSPSVSENPLRAYSGIGEVLPGAQSLCYMGKRPLSNDSVHQSPRAPKSGNLLLQLRGSTRTLLVQISPRGPLTSPVDNGVAKESLTVDQSGITGAGRSGNDGIAKGDSPIAKPYHLKGRIPKVSQNLVRSSFVDYPPFRKVVVDGVSVHEADSSSQQTQIDDTNHQNSSKSRNRTDWFLVRKHYPPENPILPSSVESTGPSGQEPEGKEGRNGKKHYVKNLIQKIIFRKHLTRDSRPLPFRASPNQSQFSSTTTAESTADVEALIKALLYGSDLRIKKQLSIDKLKHRTEVPLHSRISNELHQILGEDIMKAIRKVPIGQPIDEALREVSLQQHQGIQALARTEAMRSDIEDVMGQIQECFKTKSEEEMRMIFDRRERLEGGVKRS